METETAFWNVCWTWATENNSHDLREIIAPKQGVDGIVEREAAGFACWTGLPSLPADLPGPPPHLLIRFPVAGAERQGSPGIEMRVVEKP